MIRVYHIMGLISITLLGYSCKKGDTIYGLEANVNAVSKEVHYGSKGDLQALDNGQYQQKEDMQTVHVMDDMSCVELYTIRYPKQWKVLSKAYYSHQATLPYVQNFVTGPNGVVVFNQSTKTGWSKDKASIITQLVEEEIAPKMQKEGFCFERIQEFPKLKNHFLQQLKEDYGILESETKKPKEYKDAYASLGADTMGFTGSVWTNGNNKKAMVFIQYLTSPQGNFATMGYPYSYTLTYAFANAPAFDAMTTALERTVFSIRENPNWTQQILQFNEAASKHISKTLDSLYKARSDVDQENWWASDYVEARNRRDFMDQLQGVDSTGGIGSIKDHERFMKLVYGTAYSNSYTEWVQDNQIYESWWDETPEYFYDDNHKGFTPAQTTDDYK